MAVFAPMPSASDTTATAVTIGARRSWIRVPEIRDRLVEQPEAERVAAFVLPRFDAAELDARAAMRLLRRETGSHEVVRVALDVEAQLVVHPLLHT